MAELKFIITNDGKHFKSDWADHLTIAWNNHYKENDIIEKGIMLDKTMFILECYDAEHRRKLGKKFIGSEISEYSEKFTNWFKGRQAESNYLYGILRNGD